MNRQRGVESSNLKWARIIPCRVSRNSIGGYLKLLGISGILGLLIGFTIVLLSKFYSALWDSTAKIVQTYPYAVIFIPAIGFALSYMIVRAMARTKTTGSGAHGFLEAYHYGGGLLSVKDTASKTLASGVTIGFGGSAGLEGPSLLIGGGTASVLGQRLRLSPEELRIYLLSGAAAGISAIFKAPLTGILFALEIPYKHDLAKEAFIPATFSSLLAYFISINILGVEILFPLIPTLIIPSPTLILHVFIVGLIATACSVAFVNMFDFVGRLKTRFRANPLVYSLIGGLAVGVIGLYAPQILGVGYETIGATITGEFHKASLIFLAALIILKIVATSITLNSGGSGGLFIPSIYVGAVLGALYANTILQAPSEVIVMAAMAAMLAATNKTLLTSVAFVAETAGPSSIILTLIAATTSYFASGNSSFYRDIQPLEQPVEEEEAISILYHSIEKKEELEKLREIKISEIMTPNPITLTDTSSISEVINTIKNYGYRVYPITTKEKTLIGYTTVEDLLKVPKDKMRLPLNQSFIRTPLSITVGDNLLSLVTGMVERKIDHAYVVSDLQTMRLVGVIAEIDIVEQLLKHI